MRTTRWLVGLVWLSTAGCTNVLGDDYKFDLDDAGGAAGTGGAAGSAGVSGSSGQSGAAGGAGAAGTAGTAGVSGASGVAGTAGVSGASGTAGASGMSGTAGAAGTAGQGGGGTGGSPFVCGDTIREGAEECDTKDVNGLTCTTALGLLASGALGCHADCTRDYDNCHYCGDGKKGGSEECDGTDLGTDSCASVLPGAGGVLACTSLCTHDTSACTFCGNGKLEGSEKCDGTNLDGASCSSVTGKVATGTLSCTSGCAFDTTKCQFCGNGTRDGSEKCEGVDLGEATCESVVGAGSTGELKCKDSCDLDITGCSKPTGCDDGIKNGTEQCDGTDFGGSSCATALQRPGATGTLGCTPLCTFDTSACLSCGDGKKNNAEQCDGADLGNKACADVIPSSTGTLKCKSDCTLDQTGCSYCGDGTRNAGEACDKMDLGGATCASLIPGASGALTCTMGCAYNKTSCQYCGDGTLNNGEKCDGTDFGGASCATLVGSGSNGTLVCAPGCGSIKTNNCSPVVSCGNGVVDSNGEECDGSVPGGVTCKTATGQSSATGTLSCTSNCLLDRSQCHFCGNNVRDTGGEACDGTDLTGATCPSGYGGSPKCDGMCQVDTSSCTCPPTRLVCTSQGKNTCVDAQKDVNNCGSCGHSCLGGACSNGLCEPTTISTNGCSPNVFQLDGKGSMYLAGSAGGLVGCLTRQDVAGKKSTPLGKDGMRGAMFMAIDANSLYVLSRLVTDTKVGGVPTQTISTQFTQVNQTSGAFTFKQSTANQAPLGMCLTSDTAFLTLAQVPNGPSQDAPNNYVVKASLTTGLSSVLLSVSTEGTNGVALQGAACSSSNLYLGRLDKKEQPIESITTTGDLLDIASDQYNLGQLAFFSKKIYWTRTSTVQDGQASQSDMAGHVTAAEQDGSNLVDLLVDPSVSPSVLAVDAGGIYWAGTSSGLGSTSYTLNYLSLDGKEQRVIAVTASLPASVQLDAQYVYYLTQPGTMNAALFRVPR